MLTAQFSRSYKTTNKHGETMDMFVYRVSGTPEDLSTFESVQGEYYRTDSDGTPVWHSTKGYGPQVALVFTQATEDKPSRVVADTSDTAMANSLLKQYAGTPIATAIANQIASQLLSKAQAPVVPTEG